jgi:hypothetical protein
MVDKEDKISKIEEISDSMRPKQVEEEIEAPARTPPNKEQFDALMNLDQQRAPTVVKTEAVERTSLMDEIRDINHKVDAVSKASSQELVAQAQDVIKQIEEVKTRLASPDLELKGSVQNLLKGKLTHIDESLKVALTRAGIEYTPQELGAKSGLATPIERFIGFLTHGQYQLQKLSNDVEMMHLNGKDLTPASMLAIQIKVGYIQQEVELFANMLNKSLESIKTIMNVQI